MTRAPVSKPARLGRRRSTVSELKIDEGLRTLVSDEYEQAEERRVDRARQLPAGERREEGLSISASQGEVHPLDEPAVERGDEQ